MTKIFTHERDPNLGSGWGEEAGGEVFPEPPVWGPDRNGALTSWTQQPRSAASLPRSDPNVPLRERGDGRSQRGARRSSKNEEEREHLPASWELGTSRGLPVCRPPALGLTHPSASDAQESGLHDVQGNEWCPHIHVRPELQNGTP